MRLVVMIGDDRSVQRALGEVVQRAFLEAGRGYAMVVTATSDVDMLRALSRGQADMVVANYRNDSRSLDLFEWLQRGRCPARTVLVAGEQLAHEAPRVRTKGLDAVIKRPAGIEDFKKLVAEWFP
jgi:AmiR/NasT family two-component response regulator